MASLADIRAKYPQYKDLSDQQLADGLYKKFYSDMPRSAFDQKLGITPAAPLNASGSPDDRSSTPPQLPTPPESYSQGYVSQGMSGLNEGIASGLGAPVDLISAAINLGTTGVNKLANTQIPQITDPFGGSGTFRRIMAPTITAPTQEPGKQFVRRAMQDVGAAMLPSGLGSKIANSSGLLASQLGMSLLSGMGAATAEQVLPGNQLAEVGGESLGMLGGAGVGKLGQMLMRNPEATRLAKALAADNIKPNEIDARVAALGPDAVVGDLGPNLQGQTAALATMPGDARNTVVGALQARQAGGNARVRQGVENTLGPAPVESQFKQTVVDTKKALSPVYQKALANAQSGDISPVVDYVDNEIMQAKGAAKSALTKVRNMLNFTAPAGPGVPATTILDPNPSGWLRTRQAIDGILKGETNSDVIRTLSGARGRIDDLLAQHVPNIKQVDAAFAETARRDEAFDFGQTLLRGGENAVDPTDLGLAIQRGSTGQDNARAQGLLNTIYRIVGTNANDRQALSKILLGEGSWNREKLAMQFGQDKADELVKLFENEKVKAGTENLALANSKTAAVSAAQQEERGANKPPGFFRSALNLHAGDAAASLADKALGTTFQARRTASNAKLAQLLMSQGLSPLVVAKMVSPSIAKALIGPTAAIAVNQVGMNQ